METLVSANDVLFVLLGAIMVLAMHAVDRYVADSHAVEPDPPRLRDPVRSVQ